MLDKHSGFSPLASIPKGAKSAKLIQGIYPKQHQKNGNGLELKNTLGPQGFLISGHWHTSFTTPSPDFSNSKILPQVREFVCV